MRPCMVVHHVIAGRIEESLLSDLEYFLILRDDNTFLNRKVFCIFIVYKGLISSITNNSHH